MADSLSEFQSLLAQSPRPPLDTFYARIFLSDFQHDEAYWEAHPGFPLWNKLESAERALGIFNEAKAQYDAAYGRFRGAALSGGLATSTFFREISVDLLGAIFGFCVAARTLDEMLKAFRNKTVRGAKIYKQSVDRIQIPAELADFIHQIRNVLSHAELIEPSPEINWDENKNVSVKVKLGLPSDTSRWRGGAKNFIEDKTEIDFTDLPQEYSVSYRKLVDEIRHEFSETLTDDEKHFASLRAFVNQMRRSHVAGFYVQTLAQKPEVRTLGHLEDLGLTRDQAALLRSFDDYSDQQFDILRAILDPFKLVKSNTIERLRAEFLKKSS